MKRELSASTRIQRPPPQHPAKHHSLSVCPHLCLAEESLLPARLSTCIPSPAGRPPSHSPSRPCLVLGLPVASAFDVWGFPPAARGGWSGGSHGWGQSPLLPRCFFWNLFPFTSLFPLEGASWTGTGECISTWGPPGGLGTRALGPGLGVDRELLPAPQPTFFPLSFVPGWHCVPRRTNILLSLAPGLAVKRGDGYLEDSLFI